jgi:hypothetical protein
VASASVPASVTLTKSPIRGTVYDMAFGSSAWYAASEAGMLVSRDKGTAGC